MFSAQETKYDAQVTAWKEKDKGGGGTRSAWFTYIKSDPCSCKKLASAMLTLERSVKYAHNANSWKGEKRVLPLHYPTCTIPIHSYSPHTGPSLPLHSPTSAALNCAGLDGG